MINFNNPSDEPSKPITEVFADIHRSLKETQDWLRDCKGEVALVQANGRVERVIGGVTPFALRHCFGYVCSADCKNRDDYESKIVSLQDSASRQRWYKMIKEWKPSYDNND